MSPLQATIVGRQIWIFWLPPPPTIINKRTRSRAIVHSEYIASSYQVFSGIQSIFEDLTSIYQVTRQAFTSIYFAILYCDLYFVLTTNVYVYTLTYCLKYIRRLQQQAISSLILTTCVLFTQIFIHRNIYQMSSWTNCKVRIKKTDFSTNYWLLIRVSPLSIPLSFLIAPPRTCSATDRGHGHTGPFSV